MDIKEKDELAKRTIIGLILLDEARLREWTLKILIEDNPHLCESVLAKLERLCYFFSMNSS